VHDLGVLYAVLWRSSTDVCAQPSAAQGVMLLATMMCMVWSCMAHSNHKLLEEACLTYFRGPVKDPFEGFQFLRVRGYTEPPARPSVRSFVRSALRAHRVPRVPPALQQPIEYPEYPLRCYSP
jgi:hypothetical protein